jgi:predicted enzyme related to lactoylglutathione lyase
MSQDVTIGEGHMGGKALYAARAFKKGEVVLDIPLKPISFKEFKALSPEEYLAAHNLNGQIYLFGGLARYVNHSETPNVALDHKRQTDIALRDIAAGEKITADTRLDDIPVLKKINAILVKVPSIQEGLDFYREQLGMQTLWKTEDMASVRLGDGQLVVSTTLDPETNILVESVEHAVEAFKRAGGELVGGIEDIPVGTLAVVTDAFGNQLTLVDFSKGFYTTDETGTVNGIKKD